MKVWLDDVRQAPDGWVHATTPEEVIEFLRSGEVEEISLDHDLGLATPDSERTGNDVLVWLEKAVATGACNTPSRSSTSTARIPWGGGVWRWPSSRSSG